MRRGLLGAALGLCALLTLPGPAQAQADPCQNAGRTASDEARAVRAHATLARLSGTRELDRFQMEPLHFLPNSRTLAPESVSHLRELGERLASHPDARIGVALAPGADLAAEALRGLRMATVRARLLASGARPRQIGATPTATLAATSTTAAAPDRADLLVLQGRLSFISSTELDPGPPGPPQPTERGVMHADRR